MERQRTSLNGTWDFWRDPTAALTHEALPAGQRVPVTVPAPWQSQLAERMDFGVGWYRRTVTLPALLPGERLVLGIDAADREADVWWNGEHVGSHEGGYLPFTVDVTTAAHPGGNILIIRVADLLEDFAETPHGKQSWYGPVSGLWQGVWVERRPARHITGARITPLGSQVHVHMRISLLPEEDSPNEDGARLFQVAFRVLDPSGQAVATGTSDSPSFTIYVEDPQLWQPDSPNLYRLELTLPGPMEDRWTGTFGFRTIEAREGRLLLNGKPLMLRGALDQDYYPNLIYTPPSAEMIEDQLRKAKEMGLNCLRVHIKAADPRYYEIADRLGILIWTELPNWKHLTREARRQGLETLEGILERDWNHPSIIIWTIINENWGTNLSHDPAHRQWLSDTYHALKAHDPLRLVVDNSACYGNFHVITDIEDFHNYYAIPDHHEHWRNWVAAFANRAPWTFAPQFADAEDWRHYAMAPWEPLQRPYAPEVERTGQEPLVVSEFGNWGLPDLTALRSCLGDKDPWWFQTGYEWDEGVVFPHGVEKRFTDYALHTIFGDLAALTRASQWSQFLAMKYEIEQMRKHDSIQGYVITEFTDVHWECNGLLDMCRNTKAYHSRLQEINADDMIIPEWSRLAYWEGETVTLDLLFSHYSALDLAGSSLVWQVEGMPELSGQFQNLKPNPYGVTPIGQVQFAAPRVDRSRQVQVAFELRDMTGRVAARGSQDLYFLPRRSLSGITARVWAQEGALALDGLTAAAKLEEAEIAVAYELSEDLYRFLQKGGKVLWLAERPTPKHAFLANPYPHVFPRRGTPLQGDWASSFSWVRKGPLFSDLPTDGTVNMAFAGLTPDNYIAGVSPYDYSQRVHAGIFAGWVQKNAALVAETPLGRGRLLISTFRIGERLADHPVAAAMYGQLLAYLCACQQPEE